MAKRYLTFSKKGLVERTAGYGAITEAIISYDTGVTGAIGTTVIADNGVLSGTYSGNVLCEGIVYITADTIIYGSVIAMGELNGVFGHGLSVYGNLYTNSTVSIAPITGSLAQDPIHVHGDWFFNDEVSIASFGGSEAQVFVDGDLIGNTDFGITGGYGSNGGELTVGGNLLAGGVYLQGDGSTENFPASGGGTLSVKGNMLVDGDVNLNAGDDLLVPGHGISSSGGSISVGGDAQFNGFLTMNGGISYDSAGGDGGIITVNGNLFLLNEVRMYGGSNAVLIGGAGGRIEVHGNFIHEDENEDGIYLYGGGSAAGQGGPGGRILVYGNAKFNSVFLSGGSGETINGYCGYALFQNGVTCKLVSMFDGTGDGTAPDTETSLSLGGYCTIGGISMVNRSGVRIKPVNDTATVLKVLTLTGKSVFSSLSNAITNAIVSPQTDIFHTDASGNWYATTSSNIMD